MLLSSSGVCSKCLNEITIGGNILKPVGGLSWIQRRQYDKNCADKNNLSFPIVFIAIATPKVINSGMTYFLSKLG